MGLIGPNGAGKTTLFNLITGIYAPDQGTITLDGKSFLGKKPHQISRHGIARTFQNSRLFTTMTCEETLMAACHIRHGFWGSLLQPKSYHQEQESLQTDINTMLKLMGLTDYAHQSAISLSYGNQRRLELARALMTKPKVILLDEPAAGMNLGEKKALADLIIGINEHFSVSILLIEHDVKLVLACCNSIAVLDHGVVIAKGHPKDVIEKPAVIEAYLGPAHALS